MELKEALPRPCGKLFYPPLPSILRCPHLPTLTNSGEPPNKHQSVPLSRASPPSFLAFLWSAEYEREFKSFTLTKMFYKNALLSHICKWNIVCFMKYNIYQIRHLSSFKTWFVFSGRVLLCSLSWPQTKDALASPSQVVGLWHTPLHSALLRFNKQIKFIYLLYKTWCLILRIQCDLGQAYT